MFRRSSPPSRQGARNPAGTPRMRRTVPRRPASARRDRAASPVGCAYVWEGPPGHSARRAMERPAAAPRPFNGLRRPSRAIDRNGAEETRTPNFQLAKLALYQLSYRPGDLTLAPRSPSREPAVRSIRNRPVGHTCVHAAAQPKAAQPAGRDGHVLMVNRSPRPRPGCPPDQKRPGPFRARVQRGPGRINLGTRTEASAGHTPPTLMPMPSVAPVEPRRDQNGVSAPCWTKYIAWQRIRRRRHFNSSSADALRPDRCLSCAIGRTTAA